MINLTSSQAQFLQLQKEALYCLYKGGYGAGKTFIEVFSAFMDACDSHYADIGIFAPTISDARETPMAKMIILLTELLGFKEDKDFVINKNEMKIKSLNPLFGNFYFKSMEDPDRIVGWEFYTIHIDELDTLSAEKAERAWDKILGRARQWPKDLAQDKLQWNENYVNPLSGEKGRWEPRNKVCAYTTPEGFRFTYKQWFRNPDPQYRYIEVDSRENTFLPGHFVEGLKKKYKGPQLKAYLKGEWCNLESGSVYYGFFRGEPGNPGNSSTATIQDKEALFIGMDFNVGNMAARVFVKRYSKEQGLEWHCVAEIDNVLDTPDIINIIKIRWPEHQITIYPDASGSARKTTNASSSDISLLRSAGFNIRAKNKNPAVRDRVASANNGFMNKKVFVNIEECPRTVECLEQQAYNKNGEPSKETGHDHGNDAFTYFTSYELPLRSPLFAVPIKWAAF